MMTTQAPETASAPRLTQRLAEQGVIPDALIRVGIRRLIRAGLAERASGGPAAVAQRFEDLLRESRCGPIAIETAAANEQHYEVPADFFGLCLGRQRKYSGCFWPPGVNSLDAAEVASLRATCVAAQIADGMQILELGCGWGSLSLWLAEQYPACRIIAVSNSKSQRAYIQSQAAARGLQNIEVRTCDINDFAPRERFDRILSVEMFEHVRNHAALFDRIQTWLRPGGKLFVHVFVHGRTAYPFEERDADDWMTRHFFRGGMMPSDDWLPRCADGFILESHTRQDGTHYAKTAEAWLASLDRNRARALDICAATYGPAEARRWLQRWRMFFMACAELFGFAGGSEWWVAHYRFAVRGERAT